MSKLIGLLLSALMIGVTYADEVKDAPIPDPNYLGIFVFLAITVGCCFWFFWHVIKNDKEEKQRQVKVPPSLSS